MVYGVIVHAEVAQLVEHSPEEGRVTSSTLVLGTIHQKNRHMPVFLIHISSI